MEAEVVWHSKWAFFLLIPWAAAIASHWWRRKRRPSLQFGTLSGLKGAGTSWRVYLSVLPFVCKALALFFAILALARPQEANTKIKRNVEGIDIVVTLDISDSMLIEDMQPENRLEASKKTIKQFIEGRVSDRIGLVVFSGESYTRIPLTLDYPLLIDNVSAIETSRNIKMGTAIGVALANAAARLKDSTAKSRVIIFLTDGENNSGTIDPETALNIAKGYGLKIYSIGMGKDGQAQLPVYIEGPGGQKIKRYRPIHSTINEELLTRFATETGGKFFRANTGDALDKVFHEINRLEKTKIEVNQYTTYRELYPQYLSWAVFLFLFSFGLGRTVLRRGP